MTEKGTFEDATQSHPTFVALSFFLAALIILLFFLYKYLNKEANGKYTVQRIVYREGGLRDRAREATVALGNRLGIQLWPQSETDPDEANEEGEEERQESSNGDDCSDEDDSVKVNMQESDSSAGLHNAKRSSEPNSVDSSDEEEQPLVKHEAEPKEEAGKAEEPAADEAQEDNRETSGPMVINLNPFAGSVHWSEEAGDKDSDDVTEL
ncbi:uncharacterized protein [Eucyclogobius newberryi]|uniref:uncharacterized protein n=1 Tax=Eucyclogobius newberryi TaxID=166745 RepID=UPI003B5A2243